MNRPIFGSAIVLTSTLLFAAATVVSKYAAIQWDLNASYVTMARFSLGLLMVLPQVVRNPALLRPHDPKWVLMRSVSNVLAVFLFFFGVQFTTVSKANLLNMTYPVFVLVVAPLLIREKTPRVLFGFLVLTLIGVWNVVRPTEIGGIDQFAIGDILAFLSAVVAGVAITSLRQARKRDETGTIIFYMMGFGTIANFVLFQFVPSATPQAIPAALLGGAFGAIGQFALTIGFRYVSAAAGSILSTARIPIAWILGIVLFHDPLTVRSLLGTILILVSLIGVSWYRAQRRPAAEGDEGTMSGEGREGGEITPSRSP